jgi:hypothetical protein
MMPQFYYVVFFSLQFQKVWDMLPVNEYGNLGYREFLAQYVDESQLPAPPKMPNPMAFADNSPRPYSSMSLRPGSRVCINILRVQACYHFSKGFINQCMYWCACEHFCMDVHF